MSGVPLGGENPAGPDDSPEAPLRQFHTQFGAIEATLKLVVEDPPSFASGLADEVLELPAETRFTESAESVRSYIVDELGPVDALGPQFDELGAEQLAEILAEPVDSLLQDTIERVFFSRTPTTVLVVSSAYETVRLALDVLGQSPDKDSARTAVSTVLALFARIHQGAYDDVEHEEWVKALAVDIVRGRYSLRNIIDGPPEAQKMDIDTEDALTAAVRLGAVVAYARLDISVSRGAELAGQSVDAFESELGKHGVDPRYGPTNAEDLEGSVLDDT
ncbi:hypothetical protein [Haloarchaeobius baliensis]|uniref:hypothetical protein n=1 Tax=Haloarchaeobius baliensis TaxID=1670458 RepID=UPI003F8828A9